MKKVMMSSVLVIAAMLFSCNKEQVDTNENSVNNRDTDKTAVTKNNPSDSSILSAIKGEDEYFTGEYRLFRLEKLLTQQSPLSKNVLEELILMENNKVPDYLVELSTVLSKEKGNILSLIATERPNIDIQFIANNLRKNKNEGRFIKINTTPRKIIFAEDIINIRNKDRHGCESCSREIRTNKKARLVNLNIADGVAPPISGPAATCAGITYCGIAQNVSKREVERNVSYATYTVICAEVVDAVCFTTN